MENNACAMCSAPHSNQVVDKSAVAPSEKHVLYIFGQSEGLY